MNCLYTLILFLATPFLAVAQSVYVDTILYEGLSKTKPAFIKKISNIKKGYVDKIKIENEIDFLKRLPAFANVRCKYIKKTDSSYNILLSFEENKTIAPIFNIWTSIRQNTIKIGVTDFNFSGTNKTVSAYYQNNGFHGYGINYKNPNLFSKKLGFGINHTLWTSEEPLYFGDNVSNYKFQLLGLELTTLYQLNTNLRIDFSVNPFIEKYNYLSGYANVNIPQKLDKKKLALKLEIINNKLKYHYHLTSGIKNNTYILGMPTKDKFWIVWNDFVFLRRVNKVDNFGFRVHAGLARNENSPFAPFALDNNKNIRGIGNVVDRGTGVLVLNAEYRLHIFKQKNWVIQQNSFVDFGTWRTPGGKFKDFIEKQNNVLYAGLGFRIINRLIYGAVLRFDYGININNIKKSGLVFGIGQYF